MPHTHLTPDERESIAHLRKLGCSCAEIGRQLKRHPTTIARELRRNTRSSGKYFACTATHLAAKRRRQARHSWKLNCPVLKQYVLEKLQLKWSPEQIAGQLQHNDQHLELAISHETIYRWIKQNKSQGGKVYLSLRQGRKKRRKRYGTGVRRPSIPDRKSIAARPACVQYRQQSGHWESDTVEGRKGTGFLVTHVERTTGYAVAVWMPDKKSQTLNERSFEAFGGVKRSKIKTLTTDNGTEFSGFKTLEKRLNCRVYFADPHSPWQRGQNENTNGLFRQYFPKGMDFSKLSREQVQAAVDEINRRPRKKYQYQSPHDLMSQNRAFQS